MTLTEFLLARVAEDEAAARALHVETALPAVWSTLIEPGGRLAVEHIARHDPARVLAECRAKREIIDLVAFAQASAPYEMPKRYMRLTLKFLALPYVDHPDYAPEWQP